MGKLLLKYLQTTFIVVVIIKLLTIKINVEDKHLPFFQWPKQISCNSTENYPLDIRDNVFSNKFSCARHHSHMAYDDLMKFYSKTPQKLNISYSIIINENAVSFDQLLSMIWSPYNLYCIHIDNKGSRQFKEAVRNIISCYDNVFESSRSINVYYAHVSRLEADKICFKDLWVKRNLTNWSYLINLCGTDLPLFTQYEIAEILYLYNGQNDIEGIKLNPYLKKRLEHQYHLINGKMEKGKMNTTIKYPINIVKGSAYGIFSWEYIKFLLFNNLPKRLFYSLKSSFSPDEFFWSTLNYHKNVPGSSKIIGNRNNFNAKFVLWADNKRYCSGKFRHSICVFGYKEIKLLTDFKKRTEIFANKFNFNISSTPIFCLRQLIAARLWKTDVRQLVKFSNSMKQKIKNLDFVKNSFEKKNRQI
ncbi:hypothetical protein SNEBB_001110 [Seison nebaliae]|nr:hypothetical protein SNEBB_001110 [Seison nebaliae]